MSRRLLLLSNSTQHGGGYLEHALEEIQRFLGPLRSLAFVPFALADWESYAASVAAAFQPIGVEVEAVTPDHHGLELVRRTPAVFVGGGNTFRLLRLLQISAIGEALAERARAGMPYLGASAGTNVAAPTVRTTNDMPIVEPASFQALGLVPFQINPHYLDPDPASRHMGETREQRLLEYLEENATPVVGLREGGWIRVESQEATLGGVAGARVFRRGRAPEERVPGDSLRDLLAG